MSRTSVGRDSKVCTACGEEKPITDFYVSVQGRAKEPRPVPTCKPCNRARRKAYYDANPEKSRIATRNSQNLAKYGLTTEQVLEMKKSGCAICGRLDNLHVDHDHATGRVRGVLCMPHNTALGVLGDDLNGVMAVAAYLMSTHDVLSEV